MNKTISVIAGFAAAILIVGCTVHPDGERQEREAAAQAGKPFATRFEDRAPATLPANPSADDLVRAALLSNAQIEERYWAWRSAIEQIPQDGTQPTMINFFGGTDITHGEISAAKTTMGVASGSTADIIWPEKLSVAARRALENARAAGQRFEQAKRTLQANVIQAWYDYALTAELIRLDQSDVTLLQTTVTIAQARTRTGAGGQVDLLKTQNELDLAGNSAAREQANLPAQRAALNALLSRPVDAPLAAPATFSANHFRELTDAQWLSLVSKHNPELLAMADDVRSGRQSIALAKLAYYPNFSLSASTDLTGVTQSLAGGVVMPLLQFQAINAAIAQAESNLRRSEAALRQAANDLQATVVIDLAIIHDADRQITLFERSILPRARQAILVNRGAYETSKAPLLDWLDSQRTLIAIEKLVARLEIERAKRLADLESLAAGKDGNADTTRLSPAQRITSDTRAVR